MAEMVTRLCRGCKLIKPAWKSRSSYCTDCCKEHNRNWEAKHPDKVKARTKQRAHDPDHQRATSTYRKLKRRTDPEFRAKEIAKNRDRRLRVKFGLTLEQFQQMHAAQEGLCAICGKPNNVIRMGRAADLAVDHDHKTNIVRELLCGRCNSGLGQFLDTPLLLWNAILYLRKHGRPWA